MKKILLVLAVLATTFGAAEAQSKKKSKKSTVSSESRLNADIAKIKAEKRQQMEAQRMDRMSIDSAMRVEDSLLEAFKDSSRMAWKQQKLYEVDSLNQEQWTNQSKERDEWYAINRSQDAINKSAKLNDMQGRRIKAINQEYISMAKAVKDNMDLSPEDRKMQLTTINDERREKIKEIIGEKKEKNLEKARMEYTKKNPGADMYHWMDEVAVSNQKK
jgi:hypothetical protein